jgi:hypothetical protein
MLEGDPDIPRRRSVKSGRFLVFVLLVGLVSHAWPQLASVASPAPDQLADASLPDDPGTQTSPAPQTPESALPGSIHGVVVNGDGTVYEGVHITLVQTISGAASTRDVTSGSDGRFNFAGVPSGAFTLTAAAQGFATQSISGFLHSDESYEAPAIVLLMATAKSEVQVTATPQEIALAQFKEEEQQRVFGVIPNFYVTYVPNAPPLTSKQKFGLALKTSIDPVTFVLTGAWAGVQQGNDTFNGYGQGAQGYAKRYAANYADGFIGTMIGAAILPSLLKQDPRYFYKGTGTVRSRVLYALAMSVMCKGDNGHWQVNYSAIVGGLAAGGISNLYYPASSRNGVALTFENALLGIAGDAAQNIFQEFVIRKLTPKVPNYGPFSPGKQ